MIQLAFHEDSLAAVDLRGGEQLPAGVSVDAQEVRYLVRSAQRRSHEADEEAEGKREENEDSRGMQPNSRPNMRKRVPRTFKRGCFNGWGLRNPN